MKLGMIGLGRMGANMAERLLRGGIAVVGYDPGGAALARAAERGIATATSLDVMLAALPAPRMIWLMVPAAAVDETLATLVPQLQPGDIVVDGGNSNYKETQRRAAELAARQLVFIDVGTSGGVWGLDNGYSMMVGGDELAITRLQPVLAALAPAPDRGWGRVGPSGAGHFSKMVHNGIEYGLMAAYAEGFALLRHKTEFEFDLPQIAEIWRSGSVVRSWLLDLTANALVDNPGLEGIAPYVADSGEGRWTVFEAIDLDVAAPVITAALMQRLRSRDADSYADKLLAALRQQFGGHAIKLERKAD